MTQSVIITGASAGIGAELARNFARRGYKVGLMARRTERLEKLKQELQSSSPQVELGALDVSKVDTVDAAIDDLAKRLGGADIVIANAGITGITRTGSDGIETDMSILQTNLMGAIATVHAAARLFRAQGKGHIVGISSISAFLPIPGSAAYSASKAAFSNYLRAVGAELHKRKISVTTIEPGFIQTELMDNIDKYPFVVPAKGAVEKMVIAIEAKKRRLVVPSWPWRILSALSPLLPDSLLTKM